MYLQELYNTLLIILLFIIYQPPVVYALGVRFYLQSKCQLNQRLIEFLLVKVAFCCVKIQLKLLFWCTFIHKFITFFVKWQWFVVLFKVQATLPKSYVNTGGRVGLVLQNHHVHLLRFHVILKLKISYPDLILDTLYFWILKC